MTYIADNGQPEPVTFLTLEAALAFCRTEPGYADAAIYRFAS